MEVLQLLLKDNFGRHIFIIVLLKDYLLAPVSLYDKYSYISIILLLFLTFWSSLTNWPFVITLIYLDLWQSYTRCMKAYTCQDIQYWLYCLSRDLRSHHEFCWVELLPLSIRTCVQLYMIVLTHSVNLPLVLLRFVNRMSIIRSNERIKDLHK